MTRDFGRALDLYRQACEKGATTACDQLANALAAGRGTPADPKAAARARARGKCVFEASLHKASLAPCPLLTPTP